MGVNKFQVAEEQHPPVFKIDDSIRRIQSEKLAALRAGRNAALAAQSFANIEAAAKDGSNLMPHVISAVENKCTLGEISDVLRQVFGEYK